MLKKIGIGISMALVIVLGVVGFALAQGPTPPSSDGTTPPGGGYGPCGGMMWGGFGHRGGMHGTDLAGVLGMTQEELFDALAEGKTVAELAKAKGVSLETVVEALTAPLTQGVQVPAAIAEKLGMTTAELRTALSEGKTIADIAKDKGVELADLVQIMMAPAVERMQQAVTDGRITQEQADEALKAMEEHMLQRLESGQMFLGKEGFPGGMMSGFRGGMRGGFRGHMGGSRFGGQPDGTFGGMFQRFFKGTTPSPDA